MKLYVLTALGCIFWLLVLAAGISEAFRYGLYRLEGGMDEGMLALLAVPATMIAWTVRLGFSARQKPLPTRIVAASSLVAAFGLLSCLGVLGRSV